VRGLPVFDAHLHIIDPHFPLVPSQGWLPGPFTAGDYRTRVAGLGVTGGAVVSGSFQGFDQRYLLDALERLGPGFAGVTQLPASATDDEILRLHAAGVRAVRFNLRRGGSEGLDRLEELALRVHALAGWHAELYAGAIELAALESRLAALPQVVIDHLGLSAAGLPVLLRLVAGGAKVKASGFGRVSLDVPAALTAIHRTDPSALLFGTDLPSTRAPRPFDPLDLELVRATLGEDAGRVLHDNAVALYTPRARMTGRATWEHPAG
jgi:predicted TIM-barrel fold metal-dependent hydrolase